MRNIKKILVVLIILILAVGIFITVKKGFNYGIEYTKATELKFMLGQVVDMDEINSIVKESFNNKEVKIQKIDNFNDSVNITVVEPTDEEIQSLIDKFNSKYTQNNTLDSVSRVETGNIYLKDIVKPYILPVVIVVLLVAVYLSIRYKEQGVMKVFLKTIFSVAVVEAILFAIYAIVRFSISFYTMPIALILLIITLTIFAYRLEKQ